MMVDDSFQMNERVRWARAFAKATGRMTVVAYDYENDEFMVRLFEAFDEYSGAVVWDSANGWAF